MEPATSRMWPAPVVCCSLCSEHARRGQKEQPPERGRRLFEPPAKAGWLCWALAGDSSQERTSFLDANLRKMKQARWITPAGLSRYGRTHRYGNRMIFAVFTACSIVST